jgi:hypothetical protein
VALPVTGTTSGCNCKLQGAQHNNARHGDQALQTLSALWLWCTQIAGYPTMKLIHKGQPTAYSGKWARASCIIAGKFSAGMV